MGFHIVLHADDMGDTFQKPRVKFGDGVDILQTHAETNGIGYKQKTLWCRFGKSRADMIAFDILARRGNLLVKSGEAFFKRTKRFCSDSSKLRPMAIASPTDFMAVVRRLSVPRNFSNAKRGILVTT